jgi:high-affinity Fe2+/Pb2+ permease
MIDTIIVAAGIFVILAFSIVIYIQKKREIPMGYWPLVGATGAFVILAEIFNLLGNAEMHTFLVIVSLILFFILALLKYWDTLRMVEN